MFALVLVFVAVAKKKRVSEAEVEEEAATAEAPTLVGAQGKEKVFFLSYHTCVFSQRTTFYAPSAIALTWPALNYRSCSDIAKPNTL